MLFDSRFPRFAIWFNGAIARSALLVAAVIGVAAVVGLGTACSGGEIPPPFTEAALGATSDDLPPLDGPERDAANLEIIVFTSPAPSLPGQPRFGGTLRVAWTGPVIRLDPVTTSFFTIASEYHSAAIGSHIFESLFRWNEDGKTEPVLVEDWSISSDGLSYTLNLREGLKFHDASPLTSEDVRMSLDRWKSTGSTQAGIVRKFAASRWLQTPDESTIIATFQESLPSFIDLLGQPYLTPYVMPRGQALRQPRRTVNEIIGTGPYAEAGWKFGESVTVERYRDYAARPEPTSGYAGEQIAWIDKISWVEINDPALQVAALQAGTVDVIDGADLSAYGNLQDDPAINVLLGRPGNRSVVYLNPAAAPFGDVRARLAAQAAIDVQTAMAGMGDPEMWATCAAVYWCDGPLDVRDGGELYGGDLASAAGLLADSDYDGESVVVLGPADMGWTAPLVPAVADALRAAGFTVEEVSPGYQTFGGLIQSISNYSAIVGWYGHWGGGSPLTDPTISSSNRFVVEDDGLIELRNSYALETSESERLAIVRQINRLRYEHATTVLLGTFDHMLPTTNDLKGVGLFALPYYGNAWLER